MSLIYIVEDDESIRDIETIALKNSNYSVKGFSCAKDFYNSIEKIVPDLIILDVMLPDEDGYQIVKKIRSTKNTQRIPIIMVTAKTDEMDMIKGFDDGADDYIKKPFSVMELLSRVRALLRRVNSENSALLTVGDITLDNDRHVVTSFNNEIELTYKEFELLRYLMINRDMVLSRDSIMLSVWGTDYEGESRTVDMHIKTLRKKLGESGSQIRTIRNVGYVISKLKED